MRSWFDLRGERSSLDGRSTMGDMQRPLILVVEDHREIADVLQAYLRREGMDCLWAEDGVQALRLHMQHKPDLVILDVMLPSLSGPQVLAELRRRGNTPVLMATAVADDVEKLVALRGGADDYVVKPYNPMEVVARVQAVLRRTHSGASPAQSVIRIDRLVIDFEAVFAQVSGLDGKAVPLDLTPAEFRLLGTLAASPRKAFTRQDLLEASLPSSDALERVVDSHVRNLRRKLECAGVQGIPAAVRGVGYRFSDSI